MKKFYTLLGGILLSAFSIAQHCVDNSFNVADLGFDNGAGANSTVQVSAIQADGKILVGGAFTSYNGTSINRIVRLNANGSLDNSFNIGTGPSNTVFAISLQADGKILIGGSFTLYNGTSISRIARLNTDGTLDNSFSVGTGASSTVNSIAIQADGKILIGGAFTTYNGTTRTRIARLNADGTLDASFDPGTGANSTVWRIAIQTDGKILIGGLFTTYNGTGRNYIARINSDGTLDTGFNPGTGANSTVEKVAVQTDGQIIIGGSFTSYNGTGRNRIARLNTDGTLDATLAPGTGASSSIQDLSIQTDGKIVIGGSFTSYNGTGRNYIARINSDGSLDSGFDPGTGTDNILYAVAIQTDGKILIAGTFTSYNGTTRTRVTRLNTTGTLDMTFNPGTAANVDISSIAVQTDGKILIAGSFTTYNGVSRNRIARLNADGTLDTGFDPGTGTNNTINSIAIQTDGKILIGGSFTSYNGITGRNRIIRINSDGTFDATFLGSGANSTVSAIALQADGQILIGGSFTTYNGTGSVRIARINSADGTLDLTFNPGTGANSGVNSIAIQTDGKIMIGGVFTTYNAIGRIYVARVNSDGSLDATFDPGTGGNNTISKVAIQSDGQIIIGGLFTSYNGTGRNRIARLNTNGTLDATLAPGTGANSSVQNLAIQTDGKIIIGGGFTSYNGTGRNRIARINSDGSLDLCFNPGTGFPNLVYAITLQTDGKTLIGGAFTSYNGAGKNRIVRLMACATYVLTKGPCLNYGPVIVNVAKKDSFYIKNQTCNAINVTNITKSTSQYVLNTATSFTVAAYDSAKVSVTFTPTSVATFLDTLRIFNPVKDTLVCLSGSGIPPPVITVSPSSYSVTLGCNASATYSLTIGNTGGSNLNWSAIVSGSGTPPSGYCIPTMFPTNSCSYINNVTTSGAASNITSSVSAGFTSSSGPGVSYFNNVSVSAVTGSTFTLTVQAQGSCNIAYFSVWVDWNQNGVFDAGELMVNNISTGNTLTNFSINVPASATTGATRMRIIDWTNGGAPGVCATLSGWYGETEDFLVYVMGGVTMSPLSGTVTPSGAQTTTVTFSSTGLLAGTYSSTITINSNDPANPAVTVPCVLNVVGNPDFVFAGLGDTVPTLCLDLDSIMAFTTSTDTVYITNTGCDTLRLDSLKFSPSVFSLDMATFPILPGDTGRIAVLFSPVTAGTFSGTATIYTNDLDTAICLKGKAFPQPTISVIPTALSATLACTDSSSTTLTINNTGGSNLNYNISILNPMMSNVLPVAASCTPATTGYCCGMGIYNVTLNTINNTTLDGSEGYKDYTSTQNTILIPGQTYTLSVQTGVSYNEYVEAWIDYNNDGTFSGGEQVMNNLNTLPSTIHTATFTVPSSAAKNKSVRMRVSSDYQFSLVPTPCSNADYGQAEDYTIKLLGWVALSPTSGTVTPSSSNTITVTFNSTNLIVGTYTASVSISNNDPLNNPLVVPCTLTVVGAPDFVFAGLGDTVPTLCLDLDSIMEYTTSMDSIGITNTGCDTLWLDSLKFSPSQFSLLTNSPYILPGDTGGVIVQFAPTSVGNFTGTLNLYTNDLDTVFCLKGKAFPRPIISFTPATFNITLSCNDSIIDTLIITNSGGTILTWNGQVAGSQSPSGYCVPSYGSLCSSNDYIENFSFNTLSKLLSGCNGLPNNYIYDQSVTTTVLPGSTYPMSMQAGSSFNQGFGVWIDYNRDGDYADAGEFVYASPTWSTATFNTSITIPLSASIGKTRLRVRCAYNSTVGASQYCSNFGYGEVEEYDVTIGGTGVSLNPTSGSAAVSGGTDTVFVQFNSTGFLIGSYPFSIIINSNDPLNPVDTIPVIMNVVGTSDFDLVGLGDTTAPMCLDLDSIMEYTTSTDSIGITNTGCDTLWLDSLIFSPSQFSLAANSPFILPGDTGGVIVQFAPTSVGNFTGTLNLYTNDLDTAFCLKGKSFARPIQCHSPDSFFITIPVCLDTVTDQMLICNSGLSNLYWNITTQFSLCDDFDPGIDGTIWSVNTGLANTNCGPFSGNGLWFGNVGTREAATVDLNTLAGGNTSFYIKLPQTGGSSPCEDADQPSESIVLEYSNAGAAGPWTTIATYAYNAYPNLTLINQPIPAGAQTSSTRFRWRQLGHSGTCCDHWLIDNVCITTGSTNVIPVPSTGTTVPTGTTTVTMQFTNNGLSGGTYNIPVFINSNDPLNPVDTVVVILTIDSVGPDAPAANDVSVCFGNPTPPLIAVPSIASDTVKWYNFAWALVSTNDTLITGQTAIGTYTYYVTATDSINGCESVADTVSLFINSAPLEPTANNDSSCFGSVVPFLSSTGTIRQWYISSPPVTPVFTGNPYNTGQTAVGTYTFFVTDSTGGCPESAADTVVLKINALPNKPLAKDTAVCFGGPVPPLTATVTGTDSIRWYNTSMVLQATGDTFLHGQTAAGTYTYYVTSVDTVTKCESVKDTAILIISNTPQPTANNVSSCFGSPTPPLVATPNNSIQWYDASMAPLAANDTLITGLTAVGSYTFYVTQTLSGCTSNPKLVTLTINPIPAVPTAPDMSSCFGSPTPALTATGTNISWYTNPALTPLIAVGSPYNTGITAVGTYTYYVTQTAAGCTSPSDTVYLTIYALPAIPVAADTFVCFGNPTPNLVATGISGNDTVKWYNNPALTPILFTGNPYATGQTAIGTYTYYVTQTDTATGCRSNPDMVTLTINSVPVEPTANDATVCFGSPTPPLSSTGTINQWYNNPALSPTLFTGNPYNTGVTAVGTYTYFVTDSTAGCPESPADTAMLTINPIPAAPFASNDTLICFGDPTPDLISNIVNTQWYNSAMVLVFTGDTFVTGLTAAGTYTFYAGQTVLGCQSPKDTVLLTINFTPVPVANDVTSTFGNPTPNLTSTGSNVQWYNSSMVLVFSGNPFPTGQTAVGTYTYYATQTINGCESAMDIAILTIYPGAPVGTNATACFGQPVPDLTATGTNIQWYSDPALTTLVGTGSPFATGQTAAGTYTYYVTQTINFVQSTSDTVTLTINALPSAPTASNQNACFGEIIPNLTATGTNIQWYDNTSALVFTGSPFATGQTAVGTYTYTVTQTVNGCDGPANIVTLSIYALPAAPLASNDTAVCFGYPTPDLTATGANIQWYDNLGNPVGTGSPFATGQTNPGVYIYYATQTNTVTTCESLGDTVTLTISAPAVPVAPDVAVCSGLPVPPLTATGTNIQWYDNLGNPVFSGSPFNTGQTAVGTYTYYVTQTNTVTTCSSPQDTVYLTISNPPALAPSVQDAEACFGSVIPDLNATTGTIINWYNDAALTNLVFSGNPFATGQTAVGTYTYYVTDSTAGCPEGPSDPVILVINPLPATLSVNDTASCFGSPTPDLIAVGNNIQWYDTSGAMIFSGDTFVTVQINVGTYIWFVTQTDASTGCESQKDTVTLMINPLPSSPVALDTSVCSAATIPNLTSTGTNVQWYNSSMTFVFSGNSYATGQTAAGTYTYFVTQSDPLTGCESAADTSILIIMLSPPVPTANNVAVCFGNPVPPLTSTGTNIKWYSDASLTTLVNTGNTFNTGQTAVGIYTYWVTDSLTGCVSSSPDSATLSINTLPAQPTANDVTICYGSSAVLTSTGANPQWYSDATLINMVGTGSPFNTGITAVGTYTYYVTDFAAGCGNSPSDIAVLTINPVPLVTANTYSTTIIQGNSTTLTAYNAATYSWAPPTGLNATTGATVVASPTVTTTYTVTGTNQYGCSNSATILVVVNPLGVTAYNEPLQDIKIYPNPAIGSFTLEFNSTLESPIDIYMLNMLGEKVRVMQSDASYGGGLMKHKYQINTSTFTEGVYHVEIVTERGSVNRRVVLFR